jgi:hypothetical protein
VPPPFEGVDPLETEIEYLNKAASRLLKELGVELKTRADVDGVARLIGATLLRG